MSDTSQQQHPLTAYLPVLTRIFVWSLFLILLYVLRSIFLLIFLTFVFGYIQARGVEKLEPWIRRRTVRVVVAALLLLSVLVSVGAFVTPRLKAQAKSFADRFPTYLHSLDRSLEKVGTDYPILGEIIPGLNSLESGEDRSSPATTLLHALVGVSDGAHGTHDVNQTLATVRNIGTWLLTIGSAFLLSLLFSFLIVLDLPRLAANTRSLAGTRLRFIYRETAGTIYNFSRILGRAFEAQIFIAILNTLLTALGLQLLGLGHETVFLSVIVFFCSFVPVAGVFISSVPICLVALQENGFGHMILAILLIWIIHLVEAYVLNPKIYGHHFRMNPVIVLIILVIAGKFFHVWGLILGVPVCHYLFGHAIQYRRGEEGGG